MTKLFPAFLALAGALALSGCAGLHPGKPSPAPSEEGKPLQPVPVFPGMAGAGEGEAPLSDLVFNLLAGELAGREHRLDLAVEHYLLAAEASDDPRVAERAVRIALFAKQPERALTAARRWIELAPDSVAAHQTLAALSVRTGRVEEALEELEWLLDHQADFVEITALLAREADHGAALDVMRRLAARHPDRPEAWLAHARLAQLAKAYDEALGAIDKALALRPDWDDAVIERARILARAGRRSEALKTLDEALARRPKSVALLTARARLLVDMKRHDAARKTFEKVVRLAPDDADARYSLGLLYLEQQNLDAAEKQFRRLLAIGARQQEAYYYLGRIEEARGHYRKAIEWFDRVGGGEYLLDARIRSASLHARIGELSIARQQLRDLRARVPQLAVRLYLVEGNLLTQAGRYREALELYDEALREIPDQQDLLYQKALVLERLDRTDEALALMKRLVEQAPEDPTFLNAYGYTLVDRTDRYREGLVYIEKALALAPEDPAIMDSMGWAKYRLGDLDEAERWLRKALDRLFDGEIAAHLGVVLWEQGKKAEARRIWRKAMKEDPDNPVLRRIVKRYMK